MNFLEIDSLPKKLILELSAKVLAPYAIKLRSSQRMLKHELNDQKEKVIRLEAALYKARMACKKMKEGKSCMTPIDPAILAKFEERFGNNPSDDFDSHMHICYRNKQAGFLSAYQLCAAEKQAEIDALTARIATLEQQRQQDREDAKVEILSELANSPLVIKCNGRDVKNDIRRALADIAKEL